MAPDNSMCQQPAGVSAPAKLDKSVLAACLSDSRSSRLLVAYQIGGKVVDCDAQGSPAGHHNGEHTKPDGDAGDDDKGGSGDGAHNVGPHARAVHDLHWETQLALEQRAVLPAEHDLEVALQSEIRCSDFPTLAWWTSHQAALAMVQEAGST